MTSTITSTLGSSIGFIQLKLSDYDQKEIDFDKIINQRFQNVKTPSNVYQKLELLEDNHMDYINPICPHCQSKKVIKQEYSKIKLIIPNQTPIKVYLRRYLCKYCNKKFTTSLKSIIKPGYRYPSIFRDKFIDLFQTGYRSLRNASEDLSNFFGVKISHQTIHNWVQTTTKNKPLEAITTDHVPEYRNIMDELKIKHQLCIFHFYKMIGDKLYTLLRSKKVSEDEKIRLKLYYKEIREIFDTQNYETSLNLLDKLLSNLDDIPQFLRRFILKKDTSQFQQTHTINARQ